MIEYETLKDFADLLADKYGINLVCEQKQQTYSVAIDSVVKASGTGAEIETFLNGMFVGLDLAAPWVMAGGPQPLPIYRD